MILYIATFTPCTLLLAVLVGCFFSKGIRTYVSLVALLSGWFTATLYAWTNAPALLPLCITFLVLSALANVAVFLIYVAETIFKIPVMPRLQKASYVIRDFFQVMAPWAIQPRNPKYLYISVAVIAATIVAMISWSVLK